VKKVENVLKFYLLCSKLKDVVRTGWKVWDVQRERLESVAEHIYGVQMLAIAMYKEFDYNLDLEKVIYMLSVHELEEIIIGDLTRFDISSEEKKKKGRKAVSDILCNLVNSDDIKKLIFEFEERKTEEALFAYQCDKLECDIQAKLYDEEGCVDLDYQLKNNKNIQKERVLNLIDSNKSWSQSWIDSDKKLYIDSNFINVLNYLNNNEIFNLKKD